MDTRTFADNTYRIIKRLGAGGAGTVYLVWHKHLQKLVAIKKQGDGSSACGIKQGDGSSACGTYYYAGAQRNEFEALKDVKSRYLPHVYDFISVDNITFTVMEYIEGENFDSLLRRGCRFSQPEFVKWYAQLTSALETLHSHNICHRDIKPSNIMLRPSGDICLIDFNSALVYGNTTKFISRSLGYSSPEQYELFERIKNISAMKSGIKQPDCGDHRLPGKVSAEDTNDENKTVFSDIVELNPATCHPCPPSIPLCRGVSEKRTGWSSESQVDWKLSDIYSLGAAMYHILTGKRPRERTPEVIPIFKLGSFDPNIVSIIEKSMRRDPTERFASTAELGKAIV